MGSSEVAGVVPLSNWNAAAGASSSSPLALVDQNGNPTTATVTWTSDNIWESSSVPNQAGNDRMMRGYLDNGRMDTTTVTVSGLPPSANGYNVYIYVEDLGTATKTGIYQISGPGITTTSTILQFEPNTSFSGTFFQPTSSNPVGNYVVLTIPNVSGFTLSATPNTASIPYRRAPINGMQIVPAGPPTPDFTVSVTPATQTVNAGNATTYTVSITPLNGFTGTVNLAATGLPAGATPSFSPGSISGSVTSTLTVTTTPSSSASNSSFTITGTSGSLTHSANASLNVVAPDFSVAVSPGTTSVAPSGTATYTVTVGALNGFTGNVSLTASGLPAGATYSFSPASIPTSGNSTLSIVAGSTTGSSTLTITGTSGTLTHSANVILNVTTAGSSGGVISIDFVGTGVAMGGSEVAGVMAVSNWNDAGGASSSSPLSLEDQNGNPTTATVTWTSDNGWAQPITDQPGNVRMMKGYLDNGHQDTTIVNITGLPSDPNGFKIYVYAQGASNNSSNTGIYQVSGTGITASSVALTYNSNFNGTFTQATASSPIGNYVVLTIPSVSSFTLSAIPSTASSGFPRAPINGIQVVPQ